jgi:predicted flap endonuclease-1-like 5' DNA nuclease
MLSIAKSILFVNVSQQQGDLPWWGWFLLIVLILLGFVFLWQRLGLARGGENPAMPFKDAKDVKDEDKPQPTAPAKPQAVAPAPLQTKADDLTVIEGIGPKIATALQEVGITTFAQIAVLDLDTLKKTLRDANLNLADPESWAEQAKLLVEGKMDELKALQATLKGGRRA